MKPRVLILHADGTNRDHEAAQAFDLAGAASEIVHLNQLRKHEKRWGDYQLLCVPGGFSYADALGAGKLLALDLNAYFADEVPGFYFFVGSTAKGVDGETAPSNHSPKFHLDEAALPIGVNAMLSVVDEALRTDS